MEDCILLKQTTVLWLKKHSSVEEYTTSLRTVLPMGIILLLLTLHAGYIKIVHQMILPLSKFESA